MSFILPWCEIPSLDPIIESALSEMMRHSYENPNHRFNCACKDKWLRSAKNAFVGLDEVGRDNLYYLLHALARGVY